MIGWMRERWLDWRGSIRSCWRSHKSADGRVATAWTLRKGEALAVEWNQVDLERRTITLHDHQTKNSEPRIVPLPSAVVAMLRPLQSNHGKVFDGATCARNGKRPVRA
jgi:integrase